MSNPRWKSRIVGHGEEPPDQLLANPKNWRLHPRYQQEALESAIADVGFIRSVTVNKRTGHILDGHLRAMMADRLGVPTIDVEYVDIDEDLEAEVLATFDPISALAAPDTAKLKEILDEVVTDEEPLRHMLATLAKGAREELDLLDDLGLDDEDGGSRERDDRNTSRYPLPIVLDQATYRRWVAYKDGLGLRSDTAAFQELLNTVSPED